MKKSELKTGMVCETADKELGLVLGNRILFEDCVLFLKSLDEDLYNVSKDKNEVDVCTVVAVYTVKEVYGIHEVFDRDNLECIWERDTIKEIRWNEVPDSWRRVLTHYLV